MKINFIVNNDPMHFFEINQDIIEVTTDDNIIILKKAVNNNDKSVLRQLQECVYGIENYQLVLEDNVYDIYKYLYYLFNIQNNFYEELRFIRR